MLELRQAVVSRISNDATIQSIMGGSASDRRIYYWYPEGDIVYTERTVECAIIYRMSLTGYPYRWSYPSEFSGHQLFFRIVSINQLKLGQVVEKLIDLFDQGSLQTTNWSVRHLQLLSSVDGMNEGEATKPIHTHNQSYQLSVVLRR